MSRMESYSHHRATTPLPSISLVCRPEQARYLVHLSTEADSASAALAVLRRVAQRGEEVLATVGVRVLVGDLDLPQESGKLSNAATRLHLGLTLPLAKEASFWERAQKLAQLDDLLRTLMAEGKKSKPSVEVRRDLPVFVVTDPEAFRSQLVARLHERARSLGGSDGVLLKELRFDRPVNQRSVSLEEVELSLPVEGAAELTLR